MTHQRYLRRRLLLVCLISILAFVAFSYLTAPPKIVKGWSQLIRNGLSSKYTFSSPHQLFAQSESLTLLAVIYSSRDDATLRKGIRETWGQYLNLASKSRLLFIMDKSISDDKLTEEENTFKDIVRMDFVDSPRNQTTRAIKLFQWIVDSGMKVQYLLRVDMKAFVNIPKLVDLVKGISANKYMLGRMTENTKPERNKDSPWYISTDEYPEEDFPEYLQSYGYLITGNLIPALLEEDKNSKRIWIEDVYITGILAQKLHVRLYRSEYITHYKPTNKCDYTKMIICLCTSDYETIKQFYQNVEMPDEECGS